MFILDDSEQVIVSGFGPRFRNVKAVDKDGRQIAMDDLIEEYAEPSYATAPNETVII